MKRILINCGIACYLFALAYGLSVQIFKFQKRTNPLFYYFVWDMYSGWCGYEERIHLIAEGESGQHYRLTPGPWKEFIPYGASGRHNYDFWNSYQGRLALQTLNHTTHERMAKIRVVQEVWPKKFNLPDHLWSQRHDDDPKDKHSYYVVRSELDPEGRTLVNNVEWNAKLVHWSMMDNPRLLDDMHRNRPMIAVDAAPVSAPNEIIPAEYLSPLPPKRKSVE